MIHSTHIMGASPEVIAYNVVRTQGFNEKEYEFVKQCISDFVAGTLSKEDIMKNNIKLADGVGDRIRPFLVFLIHVAATKEDLAKALKLL